MIPKPDKGIKITDQYFSGTGMQNSLKKKKKVSKPNPATQRKDKTSQPSEVYTRNAKQINVLHHINKEKYTT